MHYIHEHQPITITIMHITDRQFTQLMPINYVILTLTVYYYACYAHYTLIYKLVIQC